MLVVNPDATICMTDNKTIEDGSYQDEHVSITVTAIPIESNPIPVVTPIPQRYHPSAVITLHEPRIVMDSNTTRKLTCLFNVCLTCGIAIMVYNAFVSTLQST